MRFVRIASSQNREFPSPVEAQPAEVKTKWFHDFEAQLPSLEGNDSRHHGITPSTAVATIPCDLQDFESVKKAASLIRSKYEAVDVLCNNAGTI